MIRVCIVCEGQTEVEFVRSCLAPDLIAYGVHAFPSLLQAPTGRHRGGRVTVERLARFISHQYHAADRLTTLVDYDGFQDRQGRSRSQLESAIRDQVAKATTGYDARFVLPYVQMYEFEGLLFSDPSAFEWVEDGWNDQVEKDLHAVAAQFAHPETISDSPDTAPSKRIKRIFHGGAYSKTEHGPLIAEAIGIDAISAKCPAFAEWVRQIRRWSAGV